MDFIIKENKIEPGWFRVEAYENVEGDEQREKIGTALLHIEKCEMAIHQILFLNEKMNEFYDKIELFAKSLFIKKISIGIFSCSQKTYFDFFILKNYIELTQNYNYISREYVLELEKLLTYKTTWRDVKYQSKALTFVDAVNNAPEGYRLPTLKEAELFTKLYTCKRTGDESFIINSKGERRALRIDRGVYNYALYNSLTFWVNEGSTYLKKVCVCDIDKIPEIQTRSQYICCNALYLNKQNDETQEPSKEIVIEAEVV